MQRITFTAFLLLAFGGLCLAQSNYNTDKFQYLSPVPGSTLIRPETNIIIRYGEAFQNVDLNDKSLVTVEGFFSGLHSGELFLTEDLKSLIFTPDVPFQPGENVIVSLRSGIKTISGKAVDSLMFEFTITNGCPGLVGSVLKRNNAESDISNVLRVSDILSNDSTLIYPPDFPKITFSNKTNLDEGDYFLSLNQNANNYLAIINNNGIPVFYKLETTPAYDFKLQPSGILTYYLNGKRKFYGLDSLYGVVDSFYTGNGLLPDFHDLQVLPDGNAFLIATDKEPVNMDTVITPGTGDTNACVQGCVIQEINKQKKVIWQWRSWDHYSITDADSRLVDMYQQSISYCHVNSIDIVDDTTIIISARYLNEITAINRITGKIMWRFGGKNNQFSLDTGSPDFLAQHDARYLGNNMFSLYDNGYLGIRNYSIGQIYRLNTVSLTGSLIKEFRHNPDLLGLNMGNLQVTKDGNVIIGWGTISNPNQFWFTEYDSSGNILNDAELTNNFFFYSYRVFKFPWQTRLITTDVDTLLFGNVQPGGSAQKTLKIFNNSNFPISITGVFIGDTTFQTQQNFPIQIAPMGEASISILFNPISAGEESNTIYIVSKTDTQMVAKEVTVIGNPNATDIKAKGLNKSYTYKLFQNYPNPFNPSTIIKYEISEQSFVILQIYDVLGRLVKTLVNEEEPAGNYTIRFDAHSFPNGIYFYKLRAGNYSQIKKMVLIK
jgi:hypothetical protein